ncbi:MAG: HTH domain-containing protein [Candidatus Sulfotelmatobacter sp.]
MKAIAIASAIEEAKQELKYVSSEVSALATRRKQLENFIATGRLLAGRTLRPQPQNVPETPKVPGRGPQTSSWPEVPRKTTAQNAVDAFKKVGRPMATKDIVEALAKQGTPIRGEFQRATVRSVLSAKTDIFERISPGIWALREWPADLKQLKQPRVQ